MSQDLSDLNRTTELNFKYNESRIELELLKTQYAALADAYSALEQDCASKHSQIESLKLVVQYNSTYEITREADYKARIKELEISVKSLREDKEYLSSKFLRQMALKEAYIDTLSTTMLNLHQKIEYYKDDLTCLKDSYEAQKLTLDNEVKLRSEVEGLYSDCVVELDKFKNSLKSMSTAYTETLVNTEQMVKEMQETYENDYENKIETIQGRFETQMKNVNSEYCAKIIQLENGQKEMTQAMIKYMNNRIGELKHHYESRIAAMIREYVTAEAKYESRCFALSRIIENLQKQYVAIEEELLGKASCINLVAEERKSLLAQKESLEKYIENIELNHTRIVANSKFELEEMQKTVERAQNELKDEYERKLNIIMNRKTMSIEGIRMRYKRNLENFRKSAEENTEKAKMFHEQQCEYLLDCLGKLEAEKTDLSIKLECDVRDLKTDLQCVRNI
jgi:chromosome segregation ATPase